ncbi:MAG: YciI family protein [Janthinobacterium lividum]
MFIVLLHYIQPLTVIEHHIEEHRRFLDRQYVAGHFLMSGPQIPRTGGVILVKDLTREALDEVLKEDPFWREGIATYQVIEFTPTKFGTGIESLFSLKS